MNADGTQPVAIDASFGAKVSFLGWIAAGVLIFGALLPDRRQPADLPRPTEVGSARDRRAGRRSRACGRRRVPGRRRGPARRAAQPLALAREVAAGDPALHRARDPLVRVLRPHGDRVLRDPLHRPLPARDLRVQRRRPALDVARGLLLLQRARHRPLPALHARPGSRLPGDARDPVPGEALARARAREVVAARDPAVPRRLGLRRRLVLRRLLGERRLGRALLRRRPDRPARLLLGGRAALHRAATCATCSTSCSA